MTRLGAAASAAIDGPNVAPEVCATTKMVGRHGSGCPTSGAAPSPATSANAGTAARSGAIRNCHMTATFPGGVAGPTRMEDDQRG